MKIDLHCHTKRIKKGDSKKRDISCEKFYSAIIESEVNIVAITNHNCFDKKQYDEFKLMADKNFEIWPGIELDVIGINDEIGHVIVISNPNDVVNFNEKISNLNPSKDFENFKIKIDDFISFIKQGDIIVSYHYFKEPQLCDDSIQKIIESVEPYRLYMEPSSLKTLGILKNNNERAIIGSDVKDWKNYTNSTFMTFDVNIETFDDFIAMAKNKGLIYTTKFGNITCSKINIAEKDKKDEIISIYDNINIIFGGKGSGKSYLLKKIQEYYVKNGYQCSYYDSAKNDDEIKDYLRVLDNERDLNKLNIEDCSNIFSFIEAWSDKYVTQLKSYRDYYQQTSLNKNSKKLLIIKSRYINEDKKSTLDRYKKDYNLFISIDSSLSKIQIDNYLSPINSKNWKSLLIEIKKSIEEHYLKSWIEYQSIVFANSLIKNIPLIVQLMTETVLLPKKTEFFDYCNNRLKLINNVELLIKTLDSDLDDKTSINYIGKIGVEKELHCVTKYKLLKPDTNTSHYLLPQKNKIKLLNIIKELHNVKNSYFTNELIKNVITLNSLIKENSIKGLDSFLCVFKFFTTQVPNYDIYQPSTGEKTMIILEKNLNPNFDVFLLDEPEKSLGNSYVNDIILPKIIELGNMKKFIIIVTHNANLAVRTFPFMTILKKYDNKEYLTYEGSIYTKQLKLLNGCDKLGWKEESESLLEGGKEAFQERGEIYERK